MDLHWSWESSPSPRGFTIKCFFYNWLFFVHHSHPGWFSGSARSLVLTQQQRCNSHTVRSLLHNHQIHWKLILTSCDCCNCAIVIVIVAILRSEQKSETGVAFAVQWVARSWLPGRCKFPHCFHIVSTSVHTHLRNWESNKIKGWRVSHIHGGAVRSTKTHGLWGKTRQEKKLLSPGCWLLIIWIIIQVAAGKNRNTPVLVHCSAGVGRSHFFLWNYICLSISDKRICVNGYLNFQNGRDDTLRHFEILRRSQHWHWHSKGKVFFLKHFSNSLFKPRFFHTCDNKGCWWCKPLPRLER